jgi:hypothetical protein
MCQVRPGCPSLAATRAQRIVNNRGDCGWPFHIGEHQSVVWRAPQTQEQSSLQLPLAVVAQRIDHDSGQRERATAGRRLGCLGSNPAGLGLVERRDRAQPRPVQVNLAPAQRQKLAAPQAAVQHNDDRHPPGVIGTQPGQQRLDLLGVRRRLPALAARGLVVLGRAPRCAGSIVAHAIPQRRDEQPVRDACTARRQPFGRHRGVPLFNVHGGQPWQLDRTEATLDPQRQNGAPSLPGTTPFS